MVKNTTVIGDKEKFAIEFSVLSTEPYLMGHTLLWVASKKIGTYEEISMLDSVAHSLKSLRILQDTPAEKLEKMVSELTKDNYLIDTFCIDEAYDDFGIMVVKQKNQYVFLWKLLKNPYHKYGLDKNEGMNIGIVDLEDYNNVVRTFVWMLDCYKQKGNKR